MLGSEVVESVAPVQFPANHRQVDGPLDDLVVVSGLQHIHTEITSFWWTLFSFFPDCYCRGKWNLLRGASVFST